MHQKSVQSWSHSHIWICKGRQRRVQFACTWSLNGEISPPTMTRKSFCLTDKPLIALCMALGCLVHLFPTTKTSKKVGVYFSVCAQILDALKNPHRRYYFIEYLSNSCMYGADTWHSNSTPWTLVACPQMSRDAIMAAQAPDVNADMRPIKQQGSKFMYACIKAIINCYELD